MWSTTIKRTFLLAFAALMLTVPATASAAVPHSGFGLGIADDDAIGGAPPASLTNEGFTRLRAKTYRFQIFWDAGLPGNEVFIERAKKNLEYLRSPAVGVENVVATIKRNKPAWEADPVGHPLVPSNANYQTSVTKIVKDLKLLVDVWGPANEVNGGENWLPASTAALFSKTMASIVSANDSTALRTSPDFHDRVASGCTTETCSIVSIESYVKAFNAAGGLWGNVAAFHPYHGLAQKKLTSINDFASLIPADRPIWITEVGGFGKGSLYKKTAAQQDDQVKWMLGATGFSGHNRVARMFYYHMLGKADPNAPWDTALLNFDRTPRPAWKTWCVATHGDEAGHPDCNYTPPPASGGPSASYMGIVAGDGSVWLKNGLPGGTWRVMGAGNFAARDVEIDGQRMAVATGDGSVWLKDGLPGSVWQLMFGPEYDTRDVEISGNRIAVIQGNGSVWLKEGLPGGPLLLMGGSNFAARDIELDGNRLVVATGDGAVWLKDGLPGSVWQLMFGPEFNTQDVELSGNRIAVTEGNGAVWLKDGLPGGPLLVMGGANFKPRDIELEGERLVAATGDGAVWLKNGLPGSAWDLMFGPEFNTQNVEISGSRIGIIQGGGATWLKDGIPGGPLLLMGGGEFAARDLALMSP